MTGWLQEEARAHDLPVWAMALGLVPVGAAFAFFVAVLVAAIAAVVV